MAQVLKEEVRRRLQQAALEVFAEQGFEGASLAEIARRADTATANVYRYFESKEALFDSVVPPTLVKEHARRVEGSVASLSHLVDPRADPSGTPAGEELLSFWIEHRLAVVILLDKAQGTRHASAGARFVRELVNATMAELTRAEPKLRLSPAEALVLTQIFEGTRRTLAAILGRFETEEEIRRAIGAFRSYQRAGLQSLAQALLSRRAPCRNL